MSSLLDRYTDRKQVAFYAVYTLLEAGFDCRVLKLKELKRIEKFLRPFLYNQLFEILKIRQKMMEGIPLRVFKEITNYY